MQKVIVCNVFDKYNYLLKDSLNNEYKLNAEFVDVEINEGDTIYLDESILKGKNIYTFGKVLNDKLSTLDYIKVINKDKEIILERYYG